MSSLRRGHANLLCIVPILTDDPRRESRKCHCATCCCEQLSTRLPRQTAPDTNLAWKFGSGTCVCFTSVARWAVCHRRLASTGFHALKICAARWNFANLCCLALFAVVISAAVAVIVAAVFCCVVLPRAAFKRWIKLREAKKKWTLLYLFAHSRGHCRPTLACCPTTAASAQFCLLCCQPEPLPESLAARAAPLTQGRPCRLAAW